jgi:hypothetical protein
MPEPSPAIAIIAIHESRRIVVVAPIMTFPGEPGGFPATAGTGIRHLGSVSARVRNRTCSAVLGAVSLACTVGGGNPFPGGASAGSAGSATTAGTSGNADESASDGPASAATSADASAGTSASDTTASDAEDATSASDGASDDGSGEVSSTDTSTNASDAGGGDPLDPDLDIPNDGEACTTPGDLNECPGIAVCRFATTEHGLCESCDACGNLNAPCVEGTDCDILFSCYAGHCTNFCTLGTFECGPIEDCLDIGHPTKGVCDPFA